MKESQHTEWKVSWRDDHLRWICGFANAEGGVLVIGREDQGEEVTGEVTGEVRRLLKVMRGEMKRADIQAALGLKHEDHFRAVYLIPALKGGLIEMTVPEKPTSRLQKYRLTKIGVALIRRGGE